MRRGTDLGGDRWTWPDAVLHNGLPCHEVTASCRQAPCPIRLFPVCTLHTWEIRLVFTLVGLDFVDQGKGSPTFPLLGLPVSTLTSPLPAPCTELCTHLAWQPGGLCPESASVAAVWPPFPHACLVPPRTAVLRVPRLLPSSPAASQSCVPVADFWDTAGQERFQSMHASYYHKAHACIMV